MLSQEQELSKQIVDSKTMSAFSESLQRIERKGIPIFNTIIYCTFLTEHNSASTSSPTVSSHFCFLLTALATLPVPEAGACRVSIDKLTSLGVKYI